MRPLVAFYGDDLTGSTDTLSVLAEAGLATMLFLDLPTEAERQSAGALDAIGIAGASRTMSPAQMDLALPAVFAALRATGARFVHYKTCSTFDSAPTIGSIGHAMALAQPYVRRDFVPIVVGQPGIGRYCLFGTLFATAAAGGPVHRLDRHPSMARHPVTPMDEADLRQVLARQGVEQVALLDIRQLHADSAAGELAKILAGNPPAVLFDILDETDLRLVGRLIGARLQADPPMVGIRQDDAPMFGVGSSGLQQALLAGWSPLAEAGDRAGSATAPGAEPVFVVSGSRSPVTATQIAAAGDTGFALLALEPHRLASPESMATEVAQAAAQAVSHLSAGRSVIAHTSLGPDDPRGLGDERRDTLNRLAQASGLLARAVLARVPVRRFGLAGGDTSSLAARALGVRALEYEYRLAPGVPVCRIRASGAELDGLQIMLKGGQMGPPDLFARLARGQVHAA